jgi:hypothetical protein
MNDNMALVVNHSETVKNIPNKYLQLIESTVSAAIEASSPNAEWEAMFEKNGVTARKRTSGSLMYVRGDIVLPYSLLEVFRLLMDSDMQSEINPKLAFCEKLVIYSPNTFIEYDKFKGVRHNNINTLMLSYTLFHRFGRLPHETSLI